MDKVGRFGIFGGQYVPETVMNAVHELEEAYDKYGNDPEFLEEYRTLLRNYAGRPSMLYYADRMTIIARKVVTSLRLHQGNQQFQRCRCGLRCCNL